MRFILFIFLSGLTFSFDSKAENPGLCQYFDIPSCSGVSKQSRRSSAASLPSPAAASSMNPANVSFDRGLGVELNYLPHNSLAYSFASGTGKMGAALISSNVENSFFGNRTIELDNDILTRYEGVQRYKTQKLNAAIGRKIIDKKYFGIDLGVSAKRNSSIGIINYGSGVSGRLGPFSFGISYYHDDIFIGSINYKEGYNVENYMIGTKIGMFTVDAGLIKTKYQFYPNNTSINIYAFSYSRKNWLFNYAIRKENSDNGFYDFDKRKIITQRNKSFSYLGAQYSVNRFFIVGLNLNYYMMNEISLSSTIFF